MVDPAVGFGGFKESGHGWKGGPAQSDGFPCQKSACIHVT
jgi:aldehyde dehydrogenase (NAD+)